LRSFDVVTSAYYHAGRRVRQHGFALLLFVRQPGEHENGPEHCTAEEPRSSHKEQTRANSFEPRHAS